MNPEKPQARVYRRHSVLLSWLRSVSKACFGKSQLLEHVVSLDVISPIEAEDRVQAVSSTETNIFLLDHTRSLHSLVCFVAGCCASSVVP